MSETCINDFARQIMQGIVLRGLSSILSEMRVMSIDSKKFRVAVIVTPMEGYDELDCATIVVNHFGLDCVSGNEILNIHPNKSVNVGRSTRELLEGLASYLEGMQDTVDEACAMVEDALSEVKDQPLPQNAN